MVVEDFSVGDLVWAKMKNYPPWPARIEEPSPDNKPPKSKKAHYVFFFGSENFAWILDENIKPHSESILNNLITKKTSSYQKAINDFLVVSKQKKKDISRSVEKNITVSSPKKENERSQKKMKVVKVLKTVFKRKEREVLNRPKKVVKKRTHDDSVNGGAIECSVPKQKKLQTLSQPRVGSTAPSGSDIPSVPRMEHSVSRIDYDVFAFGTDMTTSILQKKHVSPSTKTFGFIGLGHMGKAIVINLIKSGHRVSVWNKTAYKCNSLPTFDGNEAKIATNPAELIMTCDITFCCVSDPDASKAIIFGERGILKGLEQAEKLGLKDRSYVEMSSLDPMTSYQLNEAVTRKHGKYLEAPIYGDSKNAFEGTLLILASGYRKLFLDCETCFHAIGKHAYYISCTVGYGARMSLVLSSLTGSALAAVAEAMMLIGRLGLDMGTFIEILKAGPFNCPAIIEKAEMMHMFDFGTVTPLKHKQKDFDLMLQMADCCALPMPVTAAVNEVYKYARKLKYSNQDVSAVLQALRY